MCWGEIGAGGADLKSHQHVYTGLWPIQSIEEDQEDVWGALRFKKQAEGGGNGAGHIKGINRHCHKSGGGEPEECDITSFKSSEPPKKEARADNVYAYLQ